MLIFCEVSEKIQKEVSWSCSSPLKTIQNLLSTVRTIGMLMNRKLKCQCQVLTQEKLGSVGASHKLSPCKLLDKRNCEGHNRII